jgi:hypothetical protein
MNMRTTARVPASLAAVQVTGCAGVGHADPTTTVTPPEAAKAVADGVANPEGPYTAHMRITKVDGSAAYYDIRSYRS